MMVPVAAVACVLLSRHLPTTSPASALASAAPPTDGSTSPVPGLRSSSGDSSVQVGGGSAGIGGALGSSSAGGDGSGGVGRAAFRVGWSWSLPSSRGGADGEEPSEDGVVGDISVRDDDEGLCAASDHLRPGWMEMDGGRGVCRDDAVTVVAEAEGAVEGDGNDGGGGRSDETIHDEGGDDAAARACTDLVEGGSAIGGTVPAYADDAQGDGDVASVPVLTPSSSSSGGIHSSGARSVEFNQHLLVEVDVTVIDPWERVVDYDIFSPPSAHMVGVTIKDDAGGSRSSTAGDYSARGATWSGDHSGSSSSNGSGKGSGWAVTLEEVVFTHRQSSSRLERMERRVWPTGGNSGSAGATSTSTSFLIPLEALNRHVMEQNEADNSHEPIDQIQDLVLRASLVELVRSAKDDAIDRRVAMARLVPVPLTEDGLINPVISVNLNGTASAQPVRIGDDVMTPSATSSWSSMVITAVAAVAVGVAMALCFLYMYPASVDEYEYCRPQQEEQEHIHYTYVHRNANEASTEVMEEMVVMELEGGVEGGMLIGDAAHAATTQACGDEQEEDREDGGGVASPPDLRRKMTATDIVGALSTPVKTPVKQQPITSGLGEMSSPGSPFRHGGAVDESMPLPNDGSVQQPQEEQPLLDHGVNDTSGAVLLEINGIEEQGPGSGGQSSASAEEQNRSSSGSWGLTLGQKSFCSDSSAASASSIETHLHANWKQSQVQGLKDPAPTADTAPRSNTSIVASSPRRSTSSSIAAEAGNMTTIGDATTERQDRQPRRRPRQLPSQNAPLFVEKRAPKHRKVEVKPLPTVGASRRLKKEEKKWDDSRYKFGATSGGGSLSSKDRSASTNKAPSVAKSDSSKSSSKRKRKTTMPLASISVPSDVNAKKQRKST